MIELKGTPKERQVREWLNANMNGEIPLNTRVIDVFRKFEIDCPHISYGCLNSTIKKVIQEGNITTPSGGTNSVVTPKVEEPIEVKVTKIDEMEFPNFALHKTDKKLDELFSDHEEGGGLYGGTVNIVVGESGVGKSTVLLDMLASVMNVNPDCRILYVSSEMTRNDILFYYKKTPSIAKVPTLLLMDYAKTRRLDQVLEQTFSDEYDIIVLDSYQDVIVKLKEIQGWKATYAESWLTNVMIDAAEKHGISILAIQHMTKGGQYVGSTYLKHATTAMMEIRFDESGLRYIEFAKNRRGGSNVGKRLYFSLKDGEVVYDAERFEETAELSDIENKESIHQRDLSNKFNELFLPEREEDDSVVTESNDVPELQIEEIPLEIVSKEDEE